MRESQYGYVMPVALLFYFIISIKNCFLLSKTQHQSQHFNITRTQTKETKIQEMSINLIAF